AEHRRGQQRQRRAPPAAPDQPGEQVAARIAVVARVVEVEDHARRLAGGGAHAGKNRSRSASPGSGSRMKASPTRKASTPAARMRATSAAVWMPLSVTRRRSRGTASRSDSVVSSETWKL